MPGHVMAQLFAVDTCDFLQACKGEGVAIVSQEAGGIVGEFKFKFGEYLPRFAS